MQAEKPKASVIEKVRMKIIRNKVKPREYSCLEILFRCFKNKKKYEYFDKISINYTKIFDIERIFMNDLKISNLFDYSFNKIERELIKIHTVIKFFETDKACTKENNEDTDKDTSICNSKIFKRLNIPKNIVNEKILVNNSKNEQNAYLNFHSIKN